MNVEELIETLEQIPNKKAKVIIAKNLYDGTGSPLDYVFSLTTLYQAETKREGIMYAKDDYSEEEWEEINTRDVIDAIVLIGKDQN